MRPLVSVKYGLICHMCNMFIVQLRIGVSNRCQINWVCSSSKPFVVEYYALVEDYNEVELKVHKRFRKKRRNKNREFFSCTIIEAVEAIRELAEIKFEEKFFEEPEPLQIEYQDSVDHPEQQAKEVTSLVKKNEGRLLWILSGPVVLFLWIPIVFIGLVILSTF